MFGEEVSTIFRGLRRVTAVGVFLQSLLTCGPAFAHTGATLGFATVEIDGPSVEYSLSVSATSVSPELAAAMGAGPETFPTSLDPLRQAVRDKVKVSSAGAACQPGEVSASRAKPDRQDILLRVSFRCSAAIAAVTLRDDLSDAMGPTYHTLAHITAGGRSQQFSFGPDARETTVSVGPEAAARGAGSFFPLGIEHILTGYDHLLFLVALILRGGNLIQLLKIITAFTVAHSITLGLAALDVVALPGVFVESVIALSIAYVALENLIPKFAISRRWTVSFLFGLVHGFGFSSVLREIGLPKENLVLALLNFNLGVEAGQAAVAVILVPVLLRLRKTDWEPKAVAGLSVLILLAGLWWFVERAILGE